MQAMMHPGMPGVMLPLGYSQDYYPLFKYPTPSQEN
jgi:hypothetical protein